MLVCDITTIDPEAKRRCPNPNVTYELGFATALLGEDRIVMLFNTAIGSFPGDLPFDFVQNRASPYKMSEPISADARKNLASLMTAAIRAVIDPNPKTPIQLRGLSPEKIEHAHDVANMKWLMSNLHIPTVDELIKGLPKHLTTKSLWFWEGFDAVASSSRFSLYDSVLRDSVERFHDAWQTALGFDQHYHDTPDSRLHVFTNLGDLPLSPGKEKAWRAIETARREMAKALSGILSRLRDDYKEVRVDNLSDKAWKKYRADMRSVTPGETIAHTTPKLSKSAGKKKQKKS
ncbi:hypothetical protein IB257_06170 [Achromobacter sp. ACM03]|uniref:hypothetical protein n=1 Tax=Achromobacter sp. ACM03 TaxID=2769300 RepID=UPI001787186E|nr:hypothetical protein [Achromobacter sp. ACM03]MBD9429514.1 hypothetical protein [Achromobacter sp. ACM03]